MLTGLQAVTFDFGNTLAPVSRAALRLVVEQAANDVCRRLGVADIVGFLDAWSEERDRQFREEVPRFREVELPRRAVRVMARLRGMPPPAATDSWDDVAAATRSTDEEIDVIVDAYSRAFVDQIPAPAESGRVIDELAGRGFRLAILSNWPLAATIDQFAAQAGWTSQLRGIYVSERIGTIKPHPAIFKHVASSMGVAPARILHVGDDWAADVVGSLEAGWRAAYLTGRQGDTSLPTSIPSDAHRPDLEIERLADLSAQLGDPTP
ncbi:MAG: HAD family hydrolase [Candidatus Limnocylindrales bacterium]